MKRNQVVVMWMCLLGAFFGARIAAGQTVAKPTATERLRLSTFGGLSGDYTGLSGGKNLSITAGADLALFPHFGVRPTLELRGTYAIDKGKIDSQKDILGGLRVDFLVGHRIHPYGDFLLGRGEMNYRSGYIYQNFDYLLTTTTVYSPGAGFDYDLNRHFAVKVDGQFQRWGSTPTASGSIYSKVGTVGLVYYFNFNHGPIR